jgi:predicted ester cyclase
MSSQQLDGELPAVLKRMLSLWNGALVDPREVYASPCLIAGGPVSFQPEDAFEDVSTWRAAFPDLRWEVLDWFSANERYVLRMQLTGTHTGGVFGTSIGEVPPTGRSVRAGGVEVFIVEDDRIVDVWLGWDRAPIWESLGARFP